MLWFRRHIKDSEIAPDEIFLDSSNTPSFDRARLEGRLERPLSEKSFFYIFGVLGVLFFILIVRTAHLQIAQGKAFALQSEQNSLEVRTIFAPRGVITDINGIVIAENKEREDGTPVRQYTYPSFSHVLGYVSSPKKDAKGIYYETKQVGMAGVEAIYDEVLSGTNGQLLTEVDALGRVRSEGLIVRSESGATLALTLDTRFQESLSQAITELALEKKFIAGAGVVLDVHTGAVRALVSYPSYDSNVMSSGGPAKTIASYNRNPGRAFLDHAVQGVYAPGSIVKPLVSAGALTDGIITPKTIINDPGSLTVPNKYVPDKPYVFKGWRALGLMDVRSAIAWSSDVFFYTVGGGFESQKGLGIERLAYWYQQFGLGAPTGILLPEEAVGRVPTPAWKEGAYDEPWYLADTYFTAIGQYAMQVTPLQMARATAALVNGGRLLTPILREGELQTETRVPVTDEALRVVQEGMRETVTEALATPLNFTYLKVAAKTGTAETGSRNQYDNSWVVGFYPYDAPQYAFVVVLERGPAGTGSQAVQVMKRFFEALYDETQSIEGVAQ